MKNILKKWWIWLIVLIVMAIAVTITVKVKSQRELEKSLNNVAEGMQDFIDGTDNANSHINDFYYDENTGEVIYIPNSLTLEKYSKVLYGMTEKEVIEILGEGNKLAPEESSSYIITWGDLNIWNPPYYYVTITFDKQTNTVIDSSQLGLK